MLKFIAFIKSWTYKSSELLRVYLFMYHWAEQITERFVQTFAYLARAAHFNLAPHRTSCGKKREILFTREKSTQS